MNGDLISRKALLSKMFPYGMPDNGNYGINARAIRDAVVGAKAVEAEPVVYCKECEFWDEYHEGSLDGPGMGMGCCQEGCNWSDGWLASDWCSRAKRRSEENERISHTDRENRSEKG